MLLYSGLAIGQVDAVGLVVSHEGLHPLRFAGELAQGRVGRGRRVLQLLRVQVADPWNFSFNHITFHDNRSNIVDGSPKCAAWYKRREDSASDILVG